MYHGYESEIACEYGMEEAVLISHFAFWINTNAAKRAHFHDGRFWTYNTYLGILEALPELRSKKTSKDPTRRIAYLISGLVEEGIILKGHYGDPMDQTLWFSFTDEGLKLVKKYHLGTVDMYELQKSQMELQKTSDATDKNVGCLYNNRNSTDSNDIIKENTIKEKPVQKDLFGIEEDPKFEETKRIIEEEFNRIWEMYGKKENKSTARTAWVKLSKEERAQVSFRLPKWLEIFRRRNRNYKQYQPLLSTFLNQKRWTDELEDYDNGTDANTGCQAAAQGGAASAARPKQTFGNPYEELVSGNR